MIRIAISKKKYLLFSVLSTIIIIGLYLLLSYRQKSINPQDTTIPNISQFWQAIVVLTKPDINGRIWIIDDLMATYGRHFLGMGVGLVLSLLMGILMGCFAVVEAAFKFPIACLSRVPPTAMMAVYFVLFGTGLEMYIAIIALGIFPTLAFSVYQSIKTDVSEDAIYKAYTLGASNCEMIFEVILPQILPRLIESVRMTVGPALVFLIAAELMVSNVGIGYRLRMQSRLLEMNIVYIYLAVLCITSYTIDWSLTVAKSKLCPWVKE